MNLETAQSLQQESLQSLQREEVLEILKTVRKIP